MPVVKRLFYNRILQSLICIVAMADNHSRTARHLFSLIRLRADCAVHPTLVDFTPTFPNTPNGPAPSAAPAFNQDRCCFTPAFILPQQVLLFPFRKAKTTGLLRNCNFSIGCVLPSMNREKMGNWKAWHQVPTIVRFARRTLEAMNSIWRRRGICSDGRIMSSTSISRHFV